MKKISDKSLAEIQEFEYVGFAKSTPVLLSYMRKDPYKKIFRVGIAKKDGTRGRTKYSSERIFGEDHIVYIYDIRRKKEFADSLVRKFLSRNNDPDRNIRKAFTHVLHVNGLHWEGCSCFKKRWDASNNNVTLK